MSDDGPDPHRLAWLMLGFVVLCLVLGGVWPWLIR